MERTQKTKQKGNGEGSFYFNQQRKLWVYQITLGQKTNGKPFRPSASGKTKTEAKSNMEIIIAELINSKKINDLEYLILIPELKLQLQSLNNNPIFQNLLQGKIIKIAELQRFTASSASLIELINEISNEKLKNNSIKENTYYRNLSDIKTIEKAPFAIKPISQITTCEIQEFLNSKINVLSQSGIDKLFSLIKTAFEYAINNEIIFRNPMKTVICPISTLPVKEVLAFEVDEQKQLIEYILSHDLVGNSLSQYDTITLKNLFLLAFFTGMRNGELGAIDYEKSINIDNEYFKISNTLTKDINGKVKIGETTKTGKKLMKKGKRDEKIIPFCTYNKKFILNITTEQIQIAKSNPNNINNLLFCRKDGQPIVSSEINSIFKRICREAGVKLELPQGCHFHMTRHTFATRCIEAGLDLLTIAHLLGHTSTRQVERTYGHILDKYRDKQLEVLNNYYDKQNIIFMNDYKKIKNA